MLGLCLFAVFLLPATVSAQPSAANSSAPDCFWMCPLGDIVQTVVVRDINSVPIPNTPVRIIFSQPCSTVPPIAWCPGQPNPVISGTTNAAGAVVFSIRAGGCCQANPSAVRIEADPGAVLLRQYRTVASPDNFGGGAPGWGDRNVNLNDLVFFASLFLTNDYRGDYEDGFPGDGLCDGDVDLSDFVVFATHFLHWC